VACLRQTKSAQLKAQSPHFESAIMAPITTASNESNHMELLDKLDMAKIHKPFRNPAWKPPQRRNKNLKQILSEALRREQQSLGSTVQSGAATPDSSMPIPALSTNAAQATQDLSRAVLEKNNKDAAANVAAPGAVAQPTYSYTSIQAAPSLKPKRKYCDITGLPARYQDPKTGLRYHNKEVYGVLKTLSTAQVQEYLAARGANTVLK